MLECRPLGVLQTLYERLSSPKWELLPDHISRSLFNAAGPAVQSGTA
jgi:hypothetical protein